MSKKHKSRHRIPDCALQLRSDPIDERYQTEVDYATNRLQRRYERAVRARDAAQRRLALALEQSAKASRLAELRRQLDMREYELNEIVRLMMPANRAKVGWRPMPVTHAEPFG
jgi:hypothetical protein